jgi:biopolymer transport protein ExbD
MRMRSNTAEDTELVNLSGMIDILFILIIFFLVTTTFKEEEIDHEVTLPQDARNQSLSEAANDLIKINIRKNGSFVVMGKQMTEEELSEWMAGEVVRKPGIKVLIRCDQEAKHLYLANIMSICRHVGVPRANIALKTES